MSYQSPSIRRTAEATPLPDSPAGDQTNDGDNNNSNNNNISHAKTCVSSTPDFIESIKDASARAHLCLRFKNMANTLVESNTLNQRSAGDHPSEESRDSAKGQKRQWFKDILEDEGATGLNQVLKVAFLLEAETELQRLDVLNQAVATAGAREAWQHVVDLVHECRALRQDVDRVMGQFK
ncbi:hypothetical protein Q7P36_006515 [Cladosporium allicinum]